MAETLRLRISRPDQPFHIVLVEPEIPQNTGNIARLCAATGSHLHLVGRLGFQIDEKAVRRAGLDYWHLVHVDHHPNFDACLTALRCDAPLLFTSKADRCYLDAPYAPGSVLVFGKETRGLEPDILALFPNTQYAIPTIDSSVRSLNLANAVSVALYEALRSVGSLENAAFGR
ncbi:MAG: tRNA (cytidine(34)-2'-O)-methyltransferase [Myxococcota bacterium]|nr:tRNA (cytidine(34)-2'-O)-methyltransferase [Myxococcota bacterium]